MKTPICLICLQSDILCASCMKNVQMNKIGKRGIEIIKNLHKLSKTVKSLENANIEKVIDLDSVAVILCQKNDVANIVGKDGRITNELRKIFGKQIKVLGKEDYRSMISNLMFPAKVDGVGKLYSNGVESLKVSLQKNQLKKFPAKKEDLLAVIAEITNMKTELSVQ